MVEFLVKYKFIKTSDPHPCTAGNKEEEHISTRVPKNKVNSNQSVNFFGGRNYKVGR